MTENACAIRPPPPPLRHDAVGIALALLKYETRAGCSQNPGGAGYERNLPGRRRRLRPMNAWSTMPSVLLVLMLGAVSAGTLYYNLWVWLHRRNDTLQLWAAGWCAITGREPLQLAPEDGRLLPGCGDRASAPRLPGGRGGRPLPRRPAEVLPGRGGPEPTERRTGPRRETKVVFM